MITKIEIPPPKLAAGSEGAPVVPAKQRIEMEYEHQRAHQAVDNAEPYIAIEWNYLLNDLFEDE